MKKSSLVCLFAIALIGCNIEAAPIYTIHSPASFQPKRIIPVAIDIQFTPDEQKELKAAITEWNYSLNYQMELRIYTDKFDMQDSTISYIYNSKGILLLKVSKLGNVMLHMDDNTIAITSHIGNGHEIYFLKEKANVERLRKIALHEFGHALGAFHTQTGLMQHTYSERAYQCIDYSTISQVAEYNGLDDTKMNWCEAK